MNWEFIWKYLPMYERAAWLTVQIGFAGIVCAIMLGLICAVIQYEKIPLLKQVEAVYIELSRNTPLLVQLFFIYYGLPKIGIQTDAKTCGIAGLAFLGGSYMAEAFRSGLEAVAQMEVLLFDEVTAALDPEMIREVLDVILNLAAQGRTMIIVTHEMQFARAVADRVLFLDGGKIIEDEPPEMFFENPKTERAKQFLNTFTFHAVKAAAK